MINPLTEAENTRYSFCAVRERGGRGVEMIADVRALLVWLDAHDHQLHDWKLYPASDLSASVTSIRNQFSA